LASSLDEFLVGNQIRQNLFDDDELFEALDLAELGEEDLAHPAARKALQEKVPAEDQRERFFSRRSLTALDYPNRPHRSFGYDRGWFW
jgi:hypothetical protein